MKRSLPFTLLLRQYTALSHCIKTVITSLFNWSDYFQPSVQCCVIKLKVLNLHKLCSFSIDENQPRTYRLSFMILKSFFKTAEREKAMEIETTARPPTQLHIQKYVTDDNFSKRPPLNQDSYCYYYCGGRERLDCGRLRRQRDECTYTIVIIFICITVPVVVQLFADTALWNIDARGQVSSSQVTVSAFSVRPLNLEQHSPAVSLLLAAITSTRSLE